MRGLLSHFDACMFEFEDKSFWLMREVVLIKLPAVNNGKLSVTFYFTEPKQRYQGGEVLP